MIWFRGMSALEFIPIVFRRYAVFGSLHWDLFVRSNLESARSRKIPLCAEGWSMVICFSIPEAIREADGCGIDRMSSLLENIYCVVF